MSCIQDELTFLDPLELARSDEARDRLWRETAAMVGIDSLYHDRALDGRGGELRAQRVHRAEVVVGRDPKKLETGSPQRPCNRHVRDCLPTGHAWVKLTLATMIRMAIPQAVP